MPQYLRALRESKEANADGLMYFIASTEGIKRDGQDLRIEDWSFENFKLNPVFLYVHDYRGEHLPLGKVAKLETVDRAIRVGVEWDTADEFAMQVKSKYDKGMMNAVSVGWDRIKQSNRFINDLLDVSAVPVPGDPQALILREANALRRTLNEIEGGKQMESDVSLWDGIAGAMLALYRHHEAIEDEDDHRAIYNKLEQVYRKLGKTAPEYRAPGDLKALSVTEIDGLFLEGEVRAGAVLNARNRERLTQAQALIQEVIDSAAKPEETQTESIKPVEPTTDKAETLQRLLEIQKTFGG